MVVVVLGALFVGYIIWHRRAESVPNAAFWGFTVLIALVFLLPAIPEIVNQISNLDVEIGGKHYKFTRAELTMVRAQVEELKTKVDPPKVAKWVLVGEGDCGGTDIQFVPGSGPDDSRCNATSANQTPVCWDGELYQNNPSPVGNAEWCTYKSTPPNQCRGGSRPGKMYRCQPAN